MSSTCATHTRSFSSVNPVQTYFCMLAEIEVFFVQCINPRACCVCICVCVCMFNSPLSFKPSLLYKNIQHISFFPSLSLICFFPSTHAVCIKGESFSLSLSQVGQHNTLQYSQNGDLTSLGALRVCVCFSVTLVGLCVVGSFRADFILSLQSCTTDMERCCDRETEV